MLDMFVRTVFGGWVVYSYNHVGWVKPNQQRMRTHVSRQCHANCMYVYMLVLAAICARTHETICVDTLAQGQRQLAQGKQDHLGVPAFESPFTCSFSLRASFSLKLTGYQFV